MRSIVLFLLVVTVGACERVAPAPDAGVRADTSAPRATDDAGNLVVLAAPARRVVSLMPAATDMLMAMGAADLLIARTAFDLDPRIASLPSTGNALSPSIEWIAALEPDLVIAWRDQGSRSVVTQLSSIGIPAYGAKTESIADALRTIRNLGRLTGMRAQADSTAHAIETELQQVRAATANRPRVSTAYIVGIEPPMIAGPGTFIGELLTIAGAENVFAEVNTLWPQVSIEELIRRGPDALVIAHEPGGDPLKLMKSLPGWRDLKAVREDRILVVDVNLFNRPGPNLPAAARSLAGFFHRPGAR